MQVKAASNLFIVKYKWLILSETFIFHSQKYNYISIYINSIFSTYFIHIH